MDGMDETKGDVMMESQSHFEDAYRRKLAVDFAHEQNAEFREVLCLRHNSQVSHGMAIVAMLYWIDSPQASQQFRMKS